MERHAQIEGIQFLVDLNPADDAKDPGKGKWKQKSIEKILGHSYFQEEGW